MDIIIQILALISIFIIFIMLCMTKDEPSQEKAREFIDAFYKNITYSRDLPYHQLFRKSLNSSSDDLAKIIKYFRHMMRDKLLFTLLLHFVVF